MLDVHDWMLARGLRGKRASFFVAIALTACFAPGSMAAEETTSSTDTTSAALQRQFDSKVKTYLAKNCLDCHGDDEAEAALDFTLFPTANSVVEHFATWELVRERVQAGEMPPADSGFEPDREETTAFLNWLDALRDDHIRRNAGDPGEVLARRLSASEFNYTIRDLTGVDIRPAKEFPVDPSNEAGFDNSGESLVMTPSLMNKYIDAARTVSSHLLFLPDRLDFAPHPVVTETDRDKHCVRQIVNFYQRQNTDVADYLFAAWQLRDVDPESDTFASAGSELPLRTAESRPLSIKYLRTVCGLLGSDANHYGPIAELRESFRDLPADVDRVRESCDEMAKRISENRKSLGFDFPHLQMPSVNRGSQVLVLWRNRRKASHRMTLNDELLAEDTGFAKAVSDGAQQEDVVSAYETFCRVFPDEFFIDRRGREYLVFNRKDRDRETDYRLLSAGFHSMMGYFRDDKPLCELMLTSDDKQRLDDLWFDLNYASDVPRRQHSGFIWFERAEGRFLTDAEFDDFRSEDKNVISEEMIFRLRDAYRAKVERLGADDEGLEAVNEHFRIVNVNVRAIEAARDAAHDAHVALLPELAERAFRRPLTNDERIETIAFYHQLVQRDGLSHQDAIRDVLVSILVSPHFLYRLQPSRNSEDDNSVDSDDVTRAIDDVQLASRLSYFLWSSMPDATLLRLARDGKLHDPAVLQEQVRRMLQDDRSRGLALEFAGNWLGFRQFESHNSVDRGRFPQFDDALRSAMFEEPVRFAMSVIQENRSVLDFVHGDDTFVNQVLAKHYGVADELDFAGEEWLQLKDAGKFGRGGVLPMSVFLTKNSPGLRTSPVKRGFWVVRQLLGTHIPAPPPNVPELPEDESTLGELTLRQALAKHRDHASCAGCHEKFDSVGLVFENYGPIGERRESDLGGRPVDLRAPFPDGTHREGVDGLIEYIREERQDEFLDTLCRKLLSYGLSRSLILSDEPLLESMKKTLRETDYSLHSLVNSIVSSPQFLRQRVSVTD